MPAFAARKKTESEYYYYLRKVIDRINNIVKKYYDPNHPYATNDLIYELEAYANTLTPWAKKLARKMINRVNNYNYGDWKRVNAKLYAYFRDGFKKGDAAFRTALELQNSEVNLIKSLPLEAAQRVQEMSRNYMVKGKRPEELAEAILTSEAVSRSRAKLIARTEIAKANTFLTKSRAESIGVRKFIWRTMEDGIVRPSHAELDGMIFDFDNPPDIDGEGVHLPGDFPNCRCYAEPIIDEQYQLENY